MLVDFFYKLAQTFKKFDFEQGYNIFYLEMD